MSFSNKPIHRIFNDYANSEANCDFFGPKSKMCRPISAVKLGRVKVMSYLFTLFGTPEDLITRDLKCVKRPISSPPDQVRHRSRKNHIKP